MPTSFSLSRLRKVLAAPEVPAPGRATAATASPLYLRLAEALAQSIRSGHIAVGTRLPSERTGAEQLGVSRTTVTAAYQELTSHGVIVFFLQIDTLPQKNSSRDKHLQNRLSETPCAFGAD